MGMMELGWSSLLLLLVLLEGCMTLTLPTVEVGGFAERISERAIDAESRDGVVMFYNINHSRSCAYTE